MILDEYKFLENGENFLLFNSEERDVDRILVFSTESGVDDMMKYKGWACDGTLKCSPDMYYQLYMLHILIRNSSIPFPFYF